MNSSYRAIYAVVSDIPPGNVATYGQVASLEGLHGQARRVGYALSVSPDSLELPWHRVINARGAVSARTRTKLHVMQRQLLEQEGVEFFCGKVDLQRFQWAPLSCSS